MHKAKSFWSISLELYSRPEVGSAFLDLQDRFAMDVNVVLYCLWQAYRGRRLSESDIRNVIDLVRAWQANVVRPLRSVRRFLKDSAPQWPLQDIDSLRQRVKSEELQAEHLQQITMEATFADLGELDDPRAAAAFNMRTYAHISDVEFPSAHLEILVNSVREPDSNRHMNH
jgi:uncharacterized protein (TIGR02444 family)